MRFSLNFVKEFLPVDVSASKLADVLTMAGMEVEHFQKHSSDWIFDIEVTTNRYDWLSMLGIAREAAACLSRTLKPKYPNVLKNPFYKQKDIIIEDLDDCPFYVGRVVRGVTVSESPGWLKERLLNCSFNPVNNIVDITNYCMLKWGNPLHAFDEDKLEGNVYIRRAKEGEAFIGIDNKHRVLCRLNLVIADDKKVIALAGVIGAKNTEVDSNTKNIFLEAAVFSPLTVRLSRRSAGVDTESSYRFERRVCGQFLEYSSSESVKLMRELAGGTFYAGKQAGRKPILAHKKVSVNLRQMNEYLGSRIPLPRIKKILTNLGFKIEKSGKEKLDVVPPSFRFDISRQVDIYEEVCRIYGYAQISDCLPFLSRRLKEEQAYEFKIRARRFLAVLGLKEIITFSMEDSGNAKEGVINLVNPLRKQENALRVSLLLGMLKVIRHNLNRGESVLHLFEIANVYLKDKESFIEQPVLALGVSAGQRSFFELKGFVEAIMEFMNIAGVCFQEKCLPNFTNALIISCEGRELGFLGKLDDKVKEEFNLRQDVCFANIELNVLAGLERKTSYTKFSPYPVVYRDISLAGRQGIKFKQIEEIVKQVAGDYCEDIQVIDIYEGKELEKGFAGWTLRIFYRSSERTLTAQEVASVHDKLREKLSVKDGIIVR